MILGPFGQSELPILDSVGRAALSNGGGVDVGGHGKDLRSGQQQNLKASHKP